MTSSPNSEQRDLIMVEKLFDEEEASEASRSQDEDELHVGNASPATTVPMAVEPEQRESVFARMAADEAAQRARTVPMAVEPRSWRVSLRVMRQTWQL
jgi:hypothetical protein